MDDAKGFLQGMLETVRDRLGNPLVSAFACAWAVWNFRLLLVLIGDGEGGWLAKLKYIDERLMPNRLDWLVHGYLVPLAAALVWIYLLPPILRRVAAHHEKSRNAAVDAVYSATSTRTLSEDEALKLRVLVLQQRAEWLSEKSSVSASLQNLTEQNEIQRTQIASLSKHIEEKNEELRKLREPAPKKPFDFAGRDRNEKMRALGLTAPLPSSTRTSMVLFDGAEVEWPWRPSQEALFNLRTDYLAGHSLDDQTLAAMFNLSSMQPMTRDGCIGRLRNAGFSDPELRFNTVRSLGVFNQSGDDFSAGPRLKQSVQLLQAVGFQRSKN